MANIMSQVRFSNKPSRNSFDLSHKVAFTAKAGEILPFVVQEVIPGDKFVHKPKWFTRTNPLNTAAYTRLTEYVDYYFVPTRVMWNKADQFFQQLPDSQHALSIVNPNNRVFENHPYFYLSEMITVLNLRENDFWQIMDSDVPQDAYGMDIMGMNRGFQGAKLLQYLGYGDLSQFFDPESRDVFLDYDLKLNPFPLLAYQAIYQYFERNDQWEQMRSDFFNIDYSQGGHVPLQPLYLGDSKDDMFDLRYANFKKDLFTGLLPNSQYGDEASASVIGADIPLSYNLLSSGGYITSLSNLSTHITSTKNNIISGLNSSGNSTLLTKISFDSTQLGNLPILALRQAEAVQRYKEVKQSNKYDYRSQMDAMWGTKVSRERANMPYRIGGFVNGINIDEVVNTSITDNGDSRQSANIAGKGAGAGNGYLEFTTSDYGYIIGIYKVCPELDYANVGISRLHQKTNISDYANPFFDKLGMEEVHTIELLADKHQFTDDDSWLSQSLGYAPRYYDYKTATDRVMGGFSTSNYDTWVAPLTHSYLYQKLANSVAYNGKPIDYTFFKINPAILNPIFTAQITTYPTGGQVPNWENEQFLINMFDDCQVVRNLDYNGLPY